MESRFVVGLVNQRGRVEIFMSGSFRVLVGKFLCDDEMTN